MPRAKRLELIKAIEEKRKSRVLTYVCSDRPGGGAQISDDAIPLIANHLRQIGSVENIDLFLYSRGGSADAPWPIVSLFREHAKKRLGVLIPFRAQSAATLIALGADEVVMTPRAQLGPIDPALSRVTAQEGGTAMQEEIRVEDVMSFVGFIRDKAGLGDQAAVAANVKLLAEKLSPWLLGSIYRTHSHIRVVARKLLGTHIERTEEQRLGLIVESLAEKTYSHGHAIGRREAAELGLPVVQDGGGLDDLLLELLDDYSTTLQMGQPVDPEQALGQADEAEFPLTIAMIESTAFAHAFRGPLKVKRIRQTPAAVNINLNLGVQLPANLPPQAVPQEVIQQLMQQVQQSVPGMVQQQTKQQSPVLRIEARLHAPYWQDVSGE
jgi:hypothetical protein